MIFLIVHFWRIVFYDYVVVVLHFISALLACSQLWWSSDFFYLPVWFGLVVVSYSVFIQIKYDWLTWVTAAWGTVLQNVWEIPRNLTALAGSKSVVVVVIVRLRSRINSSHQEVHGSRLHIRRAAGDKVGLPLHRDVVITVKLMSDER